MHRKTVLTSRDLIDDLLCGGGVEVVHDDIGTSRREEERVTVIELSPSVTKITHSVPQ